jgi:hypothetical protein
MGGNSSVAAGPKPVARAALVGTDEREARILSDCFRQFGIVTKQIEAEEHGRLRKEKLEACVIRLDGDAEGALDTVRNSPANRKIVVYGIASNVREALKFSKYGINAIFDFPLERQAALKVVRSTYLLVIHELRRYVRVPVISEVEITVGQRTRQAVSLEVSAGGMSLRVDELLPIQEAVHLNFSLPDSTPVQARATVCWVKEPEQELGVRFEMGDDGRLKVRQWIDNYLDVL